MAKADLKIELVMASIRHWLARNEQEYNVIEAAEACVHWNYPPEPMHDAERWDALIRAVEALEEVKGG